MAGKIQKDEFIDYSGIMEYLKNIASEVEKLHKLSTSGGSGNLVGSVKSQNEIATATKKAALEQDKLNKALIAMKTSLGKQQAKDYADELNLMAKAAIKLANEEKARSKAIDKETEAYNKFASAAKNAGIKKVFEDEAKALKQRSAAYKENDDKATKYWQNRRKESVASMTSSNPILKDMGTYYRALEKQSDKAIALSQKEAAAHEKTASLFERVTKNVLAYGAAYLGINTIINFFSRTLLDMTSKLNSLDYSMKTVIKSNDELLKTQSFLSKTAIAYGLDVLTLTERYIKFRAASIQSNMTATQTMKIFDSVAKAAGVLGLKTDEVNGVFLALEQMISKGKVTTEELRRQLGERLPGAMGIMADAMGVSIAQLDKMLKAGTVLSSEALPKFAVALEKAYGIEAVNKIDTLAAAQGRLKTSWVEFVRTLNTSSAYNVVINSFSMALDRFRYALDPSSKNTYDYIRKQSIGFNNLILEMEMSEKNGASKSKEYFIDRVHSLHMSLDMANKLWEEYQKRNIQLNEQTQKNSPVFNLSEYKKTLDEAELDFKTYNDIIEKGLKDQFKGVSAFVTDSITTEKQYFQNQVSEIKKKTNESWKSYSELYDKTKNGQVKLTKEENIELEIRYNNYQQYVSALVELEKRLKEPKQKTSEELIAKRKQNEIELSKFLAQQYIERMAKEKELANNSLLTEKEKDDELKDFIAEQETVYLGQKLFLNDQLKKLTKLNKSDIQEIEKDHYDIIADIQKGGYENQEAETKRHNDIQIENAKTLSDTVIFRMESDINDQQLILIKGFEKEVKLKNLHGKKYILAKRQLEKDLLQVRIDEIEQEIKLGKLVPDEQEKRLLEVQNLKEQIARQDTELTEKTERDKLDIIQKYADAGANIINAGFDFASQIYANQLSRAERTHELELLSATESAEGKMAADAKYDKKKREIEKRQAILKKTSAAFNIVVDTAQAIMNFLATEGTLGIILAAAAGITGGIELATVLNEPIPAYNKGAKNAVGGISILGDKDASGHGGVELVEEPSGKKWLSGSEPGLYNIVPGSDIYPSDETQKMLAQQAFNNSFNIVGLGETNNLLKDINKNTKNKIWFEGGKKFKQHGNIITEYA